MEQTKMTDTITAIATPAGHGAIAMVRISGPRAIQIADTIWQGKPLATQPTHTAHLGYLTHPHAKPGDQPIDQALATIFRAPHSFTGEDMIEFGLHGSPLIASQTLQALIQAGARPANPGEFSQRAVTNGRMSLLQAEAAADLTAASSRAAQRIAMTQMRGATQHTLRQMQDTLLHLATMLELELDFSEEDIQFAPRKELLQTATSVRDHLHTLHTSYRTGQAIKDGIPVAITGPTNAGKSSLLNTLLGERRAIVSDIHGTTRDIIEDTLHIGDYLFRLMDTAGLRQTDDPIERLGIANSRKALSRAHIILLVTDATTPLDHNLLADTHAANPHAHIIILRNKTDLPTPTDAATPPDTTLPHHTTILHTSAKTGTGIQTLQTHLLHIAQADEHGAGDLLLTNARHQTCIQAALEALDRTLHLLTPPEPHPAATPTAPTPRPHPAATQTSPAAPPTAPTSRPHPTATQTSPAGFLTTPDIIAQSLREVIHHLSELTGTALQTPALLAHIFSNFCIGK